MWTEWVLDVSMIRDGMPCFCPVDVDENGEATAVVVGMNYIGAVPKGAKIIGAYHPDGVEAIEEWVAAHPDWRKEFGCDEVNAVISSSDR